MAISIPEQLHFDPYRESGIIVTRSADRILMELPRNYFGSLLPFIFGAIFIGFGLMMSLLCLWHWQWPGALFGVLFGSVGGGMPILMGLYLASFRGRVEITGEELVITELSWARDPIRSVLRWSEISEIQMGTLPERSSRAGSEMAIGLLFLMRGQKSKEVLAGRPIGELERLHGFLKSLMGVDRSNAGAADSFNVDGIGSKEARGV